MEVASRIPRLFKVAMILILALSVAAAFSAPEMANAATAKAVKTVTVKIGGKNVTKKTYSLRVKKTAKIKTTVKPAAAKKKITFKSSKPSVARVNSKGTVTAKKAGTTKITVKVTGKNKKTKSTWVKIKVTKPVTRSRGGGSGSSSTGGSTAPSTGGSTAPSTGGSAGPSTVTPVSVTLTPASTQVAVGYDTTLLARTSNNSDVSWSTSNAAVVSVASLGVVGQARVTGISPGTAVVTATSSTGATASCTVNVVSVPVQSVSLDQNSVKMTVGGTSALKETIYPSNATNRNVQWTSSNTKVVTVDSNGVLTGIGEGTAQVTVTTVDGGRTATADVTVEKVTNADVDKLELGVTNSIDDQHQNVVLVGTDALVQATVTNNGTPYGNGPVSYHLEGVTGYTDKYEVKGFTNQTDSNGVIRFFIGLKSEYSNSKPILGDEESWSADAAYATMKITLTAGGANKTEDLNVTFAQLLAATAYNDDAIVSIANGRDALVDELSPVEWNGNPIGTAVTTKGYTEEYVVEQQVSNESEKHPVVLDAAPLLLLPATTGAVTGGTYAQDLASFPNHEITGYGNYVGIENACIISGVPGGLEHIELTFSRLKLSGYSRLVVRAYVANTNYPIPGAEQIISPDRVIDSSSPSHVLQVSDVFKVTGGYSTVDLKVFVESAGQVVRDGSIGYTMTSIAGVWSTQAIRPWVEERLPNCVKKWEIEEGEGYAAENTLSASDAALYLGSHYNSNYTYRVTLPLYPRVGNAIIRAYSGSQVQSIYLYPTTADKSSSSNKLANYESGADAIAVSSVQASALSKNENSTRWSYVEDSDKRFVIESEISGYVQVKAHVEAYVDEATYDAYTFVQFSNTGEKEVVRPVDYYALTGQAISLKATVKSSNGEPKAAETVSWSGVAGATKTSDNSVVGAGDSVTTTTNKDGEAILMLSASEALDLSDVRAEAEGYSVKLSVAGEDVSTGAAALHWVKPGIYYMDDVEGSEYVTGNTEQVTANATQYRLGESWRLGTKVVGVGDGPMSAEKGRLEVRNIDNVKVKLEKTDDSSEMNMKLTDDGNGVGVVESSELGSAHVTASLDGLVDSSKACVITFSYIETDVDGGTTERTMRVESVGEGVPKGSGGMLVIPIEWVNSDIDSIVLDYNEYFSIKNSGSEIAVYARVLDTESKGVPDVRVSASITDKSGEAITGMNHINAKTNANGYATIKFKKPTAKATYVLNASVAGSVSANPATMYFTDDSSKFTISEYRLDTDDMSKITVKFSSDMSRADILKEWFKDLFTVYDGSTKLDITDVRPSSSSSADEIVITTASALTSSSTVKVAAKSSATSAEGITHYLLSKNGVLYTAK